MGLSVSIDGAWRPGRRGIVGATRSRDDPRMITRRIGSFVRGDATPFQIVSACVIGASIGLAPPFVDGPGFTIAALALLLVLNANLMLAALLTALGRALAIAAAPVFFTTDRLLIDGPLQPLYEAVVNAPVLAWFGFDIYGTTSGLVAAVLLGGAIGVAICAVLQTFRKRMSSLEENSDLYQKYSAKRSVRLVAWVLIGGGAKKTYAQLSDRRVGNPIRIPGVVLALLMLVFVFLVQSFLAGPVLTFYTQRELERLNGATVDIEQASIDLGEGRGVIRNIAMADPNDLGRDILRAELVEIDLANTELLSKRFTITRLELAGASSGKERRRRGSLIGGVSPAPTPEPAPGEKTIDDYIRDAERWKDRLTKLRDWLDEISQPDPDAEEPEGTPDDANERSRDRRIESEARRSGFRGVRASHLREGAPDLLIERVIASGVEVEQIGDTLDITAENVSTQPWLVEAPPRIVVRSVSDRLDAELTVAGAASGASANVLRFRVDGVPADAISDQLPLSDPPLLSGGTVDLRIDGSWAGAFTTGIDATLSATPRDTTLSLPGLDSVDIDAFTLPIGLAGDINAPRIRIADDALRDALVSAGRDELARRLSDQVPDDAKDAIDDALGEGASDAVEDAINRGLGGLFGGGDDDDDR